jgi:tetratricopeptide (TPR) repeat protein
MALRFILSIFLAASLSGCAAKLKQKNQEKAQYYLQIGNSYLANGKYQLALRNLLEAKRLVPSSPVVMNSLGLAYFGLEKYDNAYAQFKEALKIESQYTDARNNLGGVLIAVGNYQKAIEVLEEASADLTYLFLDKVYNNLGLANFRAGDYLKAKAAFAKALQFKDKNCQSNYYFGRSTYSLNDYKKASESFDRAVKVCPKSNNQQEAYFYSGLSRMKLGEKELAAGRFREVLKLYPSSSYAKKAKQLLEMLQ